MLATDKKYPNAYQVVAETHPTTDRQRLFEPAFKHLPYAFRHGDPPFDHDTDRVAWYHTRLLIIEHLLTLLNRSRWKEHLVLRGSLLLKTWLGEAARPPGDIDWVFRPIEIGMEHPIANELFTDVIEKVATHPQIENAVIEVTKIAIDEIWTYERAEGRRITFPWKAKNLPAGEVQMDITFGEALFVEPIWINVSLSGNRYESVWAASKEVSLAWKLLWLETDLHPQGKDLYDATLLAEQTQLPLDLLYQVLQSGDWRLTQLQPDFPMQWHVDWENFKKEYPWVEGRAEDWQQRLCLALKSSF